MRLTPLRSLPALHTSPYYGEGEGARQRGGGCLSTRRTEGAVSASRRDQVSRNEHPGDYDEAGTDLWAVAHGYAFVTPITMEMTNHAAGDALQGWAW